MSAAHGRPPYRWSRRVYQAMRGLLLARTMAEAWDADTVEFGLVCDSRNTALRSRVRHWNSRVHLLSWSYQEILGVLTGGQSQPMSAWRAFLRARYGLVPSVSYSAISARYPSMSEPTGWEAW